MLENQFSTVLREWTKIFARRSMQDSIKFMKQTGLSVTQFNTLFKLHHKDACGVSDMACFLGITNAAASQMAQKLVEQNLVSRTENPNDRRVKQLALTNKGQKLINDSIEARYQWLETLTAVLTPEQQENIASALTALTEAAHQIESEE